MHNIWETTRKSYFGFSHTQPQSYTMPKQRKRHMATPPIQMQKPTHKWAPHLLQQQSHPPHHSNSTSQQKHKIIMPTNAGTQNDQTPDSTIQDRLLQCKCNPPQCQCLAKLRVDILCVLGAPNQSIISIIPSPTNTI